MAAIKRFVIKSYVCNIVDFKMFLAFDSGKNKKEKKLYELV